MIVSFFYIQGYYENLQDQLSQLKDAREALNALRTEHCERKQQEALERERQRQVQLAQKLDFMRQKKQVTLRRNQNIRNDFLLYFHRNILNINGNYIFNV
jgi:hypothetical protein